MKIQRLKNLEKILEDAPELNLHNFDIDDVDKLNNAMIEVYNVVLEMIAEESEYTEQKEEIKMLKQVIQNICNNLKVNKKGIAIDVLGDVDVWALLDIIKESE